MICDISKVTELNIQFCKISNFITLLSLFLFQIFQQERVNYYEWFRVVGKDYIMEYIIVRTKATILLLIVGSVYV